MACMASIFVLFISELRFKLLNIFIFHEKQYSIKIIIILNKLSCISDTVT